MIINRIHLLFGTKIGFGYLQYVVEISLISAMSVGIYSFENIHSFRLSHCGQVNFIITVLIPTNTLARVSCVCLFM